MFRLAFLSAFFGASLVSSAEPLPKIPAKAVSLRRTAPPGELAAEIQKQTGVAVDVSRVETKKAVSLNCEQMPFWLATQQLADATGCRIATSGSGRDISLLPRAAGQTEPAATVDGPFRVVLKQVVARKDFETGKTTYQLQLDAHWEPRLPVYLIDGEPKITTATAAGQSVLADAPTGRVATSGYSHPLTITLRDVPRAAKQLDEITGNFTVLAAHQLLTFEFDDLTADKTVELQQHGVNVTLKPVKVGDTRTEFGLTLRYPASQPELESFEEVWAASNRLRVMGPGGKPSFEPSDYSTDSHGRTVYGAYAFVGVNNGPSPLPAKLKGWKATYETPSPLLKQTVAFTFKGIDLP